MAVTDRDGCCLQVSVEHDLELIHWMMKEKKIHSACELHAEISQKYWAHTNCSFVSTALGGVFKYSGYSKPSSSRLGQLKKEENQNSFSNPNAIVLDKRFGPGCLEPCMTSWQLQPCSPQFDMKGLAVTCTELFAKLREGITRYVAFQW